MKPAAARRERGFVLIVVVFFAALLISAISVFLRRATLDAVIVRNRDNAARAEALARGGVRVAIALVLQDLLEESRNEAPEGLETAGDIWALANGLELPVEDGGSLTLHIEDTGGRLNLNALLPTEEGAAELAEAFLTSFLAKIVEEMPGRPEEKLYDPGELARNLIDFMDEDDVSVRGGDENSYYQQQTPPYRANDRPLLSVEELLLVEGFDARFVEALRPYVTVYPYAEGSGINLNTAPTWLLASLYVGTGSEYRLATEPTVRDILRIRDNDELLCPENTSSPGCVFYRNVVGGEIFPPPTHRTDTFHVTSEARYANVRRSVEAVIDRSEPSEPRVLAWRVR